jgi:hypothetical protein
MPGVFPGTLAQRLTKIQSFKETVWGTPGLATARWMLVEPTPTFTPTTKNTVIDEDRGSFAPGYVSYLPELGGVWTIGINASFEDIIFSLQAIMGAVAPTGGPSYTWTHLAPLTSAYSPQTYTLELAYDIGNAVAQGCIATKLSIKFNTKKNWTLALSGIFQVYNPCAAIAIASSTNVNPIEITTATAHGLISGQAVVITGHLVNTAANGTWTITKTAANKFTIPTTGTGVGINTGTVTQTSTPGIADRTVEPVLFAGETTLAIDAAQGTPGTTPVSNSLVSGSLDIENAMQGFFTGDQKYPVDFSQSKVKATLTVKLKWTAQVKALYTSTWTAGLASIFQIKATSAGKSCEIDFSGVLSSDPQNYSADYGAITQELKFDGIVDTGTLANYLKVVTINTVAALP